MLRRSFAIVGLLSLCAAFAFAQTGVRPKSGTGKGPATQVAVELITGNEGVGLAAQQWSQALQELGVTVTIRRGRADEKPGVTEKKLSDASREVRVLGKLEPRGRLVFADRAFGEADTKKLAEWIQELKTYGAQGTPDGQPLWGLNKTQFGAIHAALGQRLDLEPQGQEPAKAIVAFGLPKEFPLQVSPQAALPLAPDGKRLVKQSLTGITKGTALAALLNELGLGFRPRRTPSGGLELVVVALSETDDVWPVGWPLQKSNAETAPKLFKFADTEIELEDIELDGVLEAAAGVIEIPILIDRHGLSQKRIDLSKVKVSHPAKRTTWMNALRTLTFQAKVKPELLIDEAGRPLLWITPIVAPKVTD